MDCVLVRTRSNVCKQEKRQARAAEAESARLEAEEAERCRAEELKRREAERLLALHATERRLAHCLPTCKKLHLPVRLCSSFKIYTWKLELAHV